MAAGCAALSIALAFGGDESAESDTAKRQATSQPADRNNDASRAPKKQPEPPASNLDYWLRRAAPAASQPTTGVGEGVDPFTGDESTRSDALPGVVQLSDGILLAGGLFTTREKPWSIFVEKNKRWRRVPFITVLSITAVVVEEKMVQEWRWKAMGEPERVYTGREYPTRRLLWRFRLIDGSAITGTVKGQPIWIRRSGKRVGPHVLHERSKGSMGQKLSDLVYVRKVYVSRRLMDKVIEYQRKQRKESPASQPAGKEK